MQEPTRIVVADPDPAAASEIAVALSEDRCALEGVTTADQALLLLEEGADLLISELVLDDTTGFGLCRLVRESETLSELPCLILSSRCAEIDRILAFEAGADDFLAKPFYPRELLSRVRAVLRRGMSHLPAAATNCGPDDEELLLSLDPANRSVRVRGHEVDLTPKEFDLLAMLVNGSERVLTRDELVRGAWGREAPQTLRTVDAHMKSVRRKLGPARDCVQTVRGVGYRYSASVRP